MSSKTRDSPIDSDSAPTRLLIPLVVRYTFRRWLRGDLRQGHHLFSTIVRPVALAHFSTSAASKYGRRPTTETTQPAPVRHFQASGSTASFFRSKWRQGSLPSL